MSKGKLQKFAEMETFSNVWQCPFSVAETAPFPMKGRWQADCFHNDHPIVLELGCGRGEYTVGLAKRFPDTNFIGIDIKGARMHAGAKQALEEGIHNAAFLRTNIEIAERFFAPGEVSEIWLTFSDPQMKNVRKRLTGTLFLERYRRFLRPDGIVHVKTDSRFLYDYTTLMLAHNGLPVLLTTADLYADPGLDAATRDLLSIQTHYEQQWLARGIAIKYIKFRLPAAPALEEPGVEIPLDDYRSYKRFSRSGVTARV